MRNNTGVRKATVFMLLAGIAAAAHPLWAQDAEKEGMSDDTVIAEPVEVSSDTATGDLKEVTTAIGDLNYKIELMQSRYQQLNGDIEGLRNADSALRKMIAEDRLALPDPKRLKGLEAGVELVRTDLAQVREEMAVLRSELEKQNAPVSREEQLLRSPWIAVAALGLSFIALVAR